MHDKVVRICDVTADKSTDIFGSRRKEYVE
jgi:hypothetical protein